jgi:hypothetical protein
MHEYVDTGDETQLLIPLKLNLILSVAQYDDLKKAVWKNLEHFNTALKHQVELQILATESETV